MWVDTDGLNGMNDTTIGQMIGGDDVGMISLLRGRSGGNGRRSNGFVNQPIGGVVWNGQYFNGKQQLFGVAPVPSTCTADRTDVFPYTPVSPADFGVVEMAVNFASGAPGISTIFGSVQFVVPEPASFSLLAVAGLGLFGFLRRR